MSGKDHEHEQRRKTLETEYLQRLTEANEMQRSLQEKERALETKEDMIADLQEVIVNQKVKDEQAQTVCHLDCLVWSGLG